MPAVSAHYASLMPSFHTINFHGYACSFYTLHLVCYAQFLYNKLLLLCPQFPQIVWLPIHTLITTTNFSSNTAVTIPLRSALPLATLHSTPDPLCSAATLGEAGNTVPWAAWQLDRIASRDSHRIQGHDKWDTVCR